MKIKRNHHKQVFDVFMTWTDLWILAILSVAGIIIALNVYNIEVKQKKTEAPTSVKHNINS